MKTKVQIECNHCRKLIKAGEGVIIQGNVFMIKDDVNDRAGIIGNAFPIDQTGKRNLKFNIGDVSEYAFHKECLIELMTTG